MTPTSKGKRGEGGRRDIARAERNPGSPEKTKSSLLDVPSVPTRLKRGELVAIIREGRERR
jgi:hypothetical protein